MVSQQPGAVVSDLRELSTDVIGTLGGTFTSLLTVGANMLAIHHMQRDFLSASAWFVIGIRRSSALSRWSRLRSRRCANTQPTSRRGRAPRPRGAD